MKNSNVNFLLGSSPLPSRMVDVIYALFRFYGGFSIFAIVWLSSGPSMAQTSKVDWPRVHFIITNGTLRTKQVDIRYYDGQRQIAAGYGYSLGPLGSHAVSMPAGTRIYKMKGNRSELVWVIGTTDEGRQFDVNKHYEITREQWLQVSWDETYERTISREKADKSNDLSGWAKERGLAMVPFVVSGKSFLGKKMFVRVQLPGETTKTNIGFSRKINWFDRLRIYFVAQEDAPAQSGAPVRTEKISEAELAHYQARIIALMENDRLYLDPELSLAELANRLATNVSVLSAVINRAFGKNFNDFVNEYRVRAVQQYLQNNAASHLSLLGIGLECGFNSKSTFNRAFRKLTGVAPSEWVLAKG